MAVRIHVVAVRGVSKENLAAALESVAEDLGAVPESVGPDGSGGRAGTAWARFSAWNVTAAALDGTLDALGKPTLRVTTVDGALWRIRLADPRRDPFVAEHRFSLLDLEDLILEGETMGELASVSGLPESLVEDADAQITQPAVVGLLRRQAELISSAALWTAGATSWSGRRRRPPSTRPASPSSRGDPSAG